MKQSGESAIARITDTAGRVERTAYRTAAWSGVAGGWLGGLLVRGVWGESAWLVVGAAVVAACLLLPGCILALFGAGVGQLRRLPDDLLRDGGQIMSALPDGSTTDTRNPIRRLWRFVRSLLSSRQALLAARDRIVSAGLLLRALHPVVLSAVLVALAATAVLVPAAVLAAFIVML